MSQPGPQDRNTLGTGIQRFLVLLAMTGFAISAPLLAVFGDNPATFNIHDIEGLRLVLFGLAIVLVPPIMLWLVGTAASLISPHAGAIVYLATIAVLGALSVVQLGRWQLGLTSPILLIVIAAAVGVGAVAAYHRWEAARTWLRYCAVLPLVALALFLVSSPTADLLAGRTETVEAATGDYPSVVLVLLDELPTKSLLDPAGELDAVRFPNLAALAEESTWYRQHTSVTGQTLVAVPTILTGKEPTFEAPTYANHPDNLFSLLAPTHNLAVFESPTSLCGLATCSEAAPGEDVDHGTPRLGALFGLATDVWRDRVFAREGAASLADDFAEEFIAGSAPLDIPDDEEPMNFVDAMRTDRALAVPNRLVDFTASFTDEHGPSLYFLHLLLPHAPFRFHQDGVAYDLSPHPTNRFPFSADNSEGEWLAALTEQRHLLQAEYTDLLMGSVIEELSEAGLWDDSLVIITADHGRSFDLNTHGRSVESSTIDSIVYTPLFVKMPGQSGGRVDDSNVDSLDVLPTIAETLGVEIPWEVSGSPTDSDVVAERGTVKRFFASKSLLTLELREMLEFDDSEFPTADARWIGEVGPAEHPLQRLFEIAGVDGLIGTDVDRLEPDAVGTVRVGHLQSLQKPDPDGPAYGVVVGNVESGPTDGVVVVSVNGTIVTGSPLVDFMDKKDSFMAMLPSGAMGEENSIRIFLARGDGLTEFVVESD